MTESYVAGVFLRLEEAEAAQRDLMQLASADAVILHGTGIYARRPGGDVEQLHPPDLPESIDEEAIAELNERLPDGCTALLAHVSESDPSLIDGLVRSAGGTVFRRSIDDIQASGFHRFLGAASIS